MPSDPILDVDQLQLRRGPVRLLEEVTWRVRRGEHWVILGPNGCGKTSLLKVLMGFMTPSSGGISIFGHHYGATDWREVRKRVSLVSSSLQAHIPPAESALETVVSGRYAQLDFWGEATAADIRSARAALRQMRAGGLADRPWLWLSQGERQRVLIARALVSRPRLLILDEPCAGLDPVARDDFLAALNRLATSSRAPTIIFVTHHVEEIMPAFDHLLLLARGRVVALGPRDRVLTSSHLSATFNRPVNVRRMKSGWRLAVSS